MSIRRFVSVLSVAVLGSVLLAACGGSGAPTSGAGASAPGATTSGGGGAGATDAAAATDAAGATQGSGGGGAGDACKLLTTDEVAQATGQTNLTSGPSAPGAFDGQSQCAFVALGTTPVMLVTILGPDSNTDPASYKSLAGTVEVSVNGAQALWAPGLGNTLLVFKNGKVVVATVLAPATGVDPLNAAKQVLQKLADRM